MSIYFNPGPELASKNLRKYLEDRESPENQKTPAHEKIGTVFHQILKTLNKNSNNNNNSPNSKDKDEQLAKLFRYLGISPTDKEAIKTLSELIVALDDESLVVEPLESTGAFAIQKLEQGEDEDFDTFKNIAVFKIGRKRAAMETMARQLAHSLGLSKYMLPCMFSAMMNPPIPEVEYDKDGEPLSEDTVEELWNGSDKVYVNQDELEPLDNNSKKFSSDSVGVFDQDFDLDADYDNDSESTACAVVGVIQPFLYPKEEEDSLYDFTCMTIFALALGLRDGKKDGFIGCTFFDVDDCMPIRIDPLLNWSLEESQNYPSAIDIPYLDKDPRTTTLLSNEEIHKLAMLVNKWDISTIITQLKKLKIHYEDRIAEQTQPAVDLDSAKTITDEGGNSVKIIKAKPHDINGNINHFDPEGTKANKRSLFLNSQMEACNLRLFRIKEFITERYWKKDPFTPQDIVFAVDKFGSIYHKAITTSPTTLPKAIQQIANTQGPHHLTGRVPPRQAKIEIPPEDFHSLSSSTSSWGSSLSMSQEFNRTYSNDFDQASNSNNNAGPKNVITFEKEVLEKLSDLQFLEESSDSDEN